MTRRTVVKCDGSVEAASVKPGGSQSFAFDADQMHEVLFSKSYLKYFAVTVNIFLKNEHQNTIGIFFIGFCGQLKMICYLFFR